MTQAHSRTVDTEAEVIEILVAISQVIRTNGKKSQCTCRKTIRGRRKTS